MTDTVVTTDAPARNGHTEGLLPPTALLAPPRPPYVPRVRDWARWAPGACTVLTVVTVIAVTLWQLHPNLLLNPNTTTTGGDTGAHYILPLYLRSLLEHGHLTGWDPGWYDGFPLYTYYFVLPDLWAAVTSFIVPYNLAFKWATVLGSVTLPVCCWAMGRLFRLRLPGPAVLAAAALPFLFDYTWTIYGGNLFSTLAGEYAFSLSLSLALLFLGLFAWGIRAGRRRGWTAVVLALCIAAHMLPALFALVGAAVITVLELLPRRYRLSEEGWGRFARASQVQSPLRALWWGVSTAGLGFLLSGWWLVPFGLEQAYANSMGYTNVTTFRTLMFPVADRWVIVLGAIAVLVAIGTLSRFGIVLSVLWGFSALALWFDPQGKLYNTRFLPFWFLCAYLLAGWLVAVACAAAARAWRRYRQNRWAHQVAWARTVPDAAAASPYPAMRRPGPARWAPGAVGGALIALLGALLVVVPPFAYTAMGDQWPSWLPWPVHFNGGQAQVSGWAAYNYVGVQGQASYPELQAIESTMQRVGRTDGCGRAMWEYNASLDRFGTPMALMALPQWTDGCIDSMEGLLFESSATTPYHFLNQAELSVAPSDPQVGLPYGALDVPLGIEHLQMLGVRYYMASSPETQQAANADPNLHLVAHIGPFTGYYQGETLHTTWDVYRVADSQIVTPVANRPVVLTGVGQSQSSWLEPSVAWYLDPSRWNVLRTAGGPASWTRAPSAARPAAVPEPATRVSDVRIGDESISFHVSRVGTPVLVKTSYFPNWHATGAQGPYRTMPNLMVVVPTSHEVTLTYGATPADRLGTAATLVGVALLVVPFVWRLVARRRRARAPAAA